MVSSKWKIVSTSFFELTNFEQLIMSRGGVKLVGSIDLGPFNYSTPVLWNENVF